MFEAVVLICLNAGAGPCREMLLPGFEADNQQACEAALAEAPPQTPAGTAAFCQPKGAALAVDEIAEGVFVHSGLIEEPDEVNLGDVSNLGFVIGDASVAVIDSGSARWMGEALWRSIRQRTDKPVSHVILTHMHPDHVFGATLFADAGAELVGHERLPRALADRQANYLESLHRLIGEEAMIGTVSPDISHRIGAEDQIDLGNRVLTLTAWPTAHTPADLTVFDTKSGTLFAGDLVFDQHTPALDGSVLGWQDVMARMKAQAALRVVPGHGAASLPWPAGTAALERYLQTLVTDTRAAIADGTRLGDAVKTIAADEAEHWHLFEAYNPRNATVAFTELEWE
ncbi:quinoprotein relay system zinc metallohydrolase 2 [Primorskyibacter flagellatus]|uniref:quinoprotein relay system zinc metallohydrolase 2 n=1 Tax=Primorskyibacter flagellatus TaxID=1387277 RepID=UPI003A92A30C